LFDELHAILHQSDELGVKLGSKSHNLHVDDAQRDWFTARAADGDFTKYGRYLQDLI
jgi:hypothetical protein